MKKHATVLGAAIAATLGATAADAATYTASLVSVATFSANGSSAGNITSSSATWSYDDVTNLLSQTGGTFNVRFTTAPTTTLFRHSITGLALGNGGAASASTFTCTEGNFGTNVGASICGNYLFGANYANESTATWGPGTATARTIGGDDMAIGPIQSVAAYDGFSTVSWVGTTLTLSNATATSGQTWVLNAGPQAVVPVPAAVWLFGSALGLLGAARRRAKA